MIRALVFDMDGVLIDSEERWDAARRAVAARAGRPWKPGATAAMQGMSAPEWEAYLHEEIGIPQPPGEIGREVVDAMAAQYREALPLLPGAQAAVRALADGTRLSLGVASSSNKELLELVLELAGLADAFAAVVSSEEVARGKPEPDVYLEAARRLGVDPRACVAIEDSTNGLRSAAAAGMTVVAVPSAAYPPAEEALALAARTVPSVADVTPALIDDLRSAAR